MSHLALLDSPHLPSTAPSVDVVVPVRNEAHVLEHSIRRLHGYLASTFPFSFRITIADNASVDATWSVASALAEELDGVETVRLDLPGRGRALNAVWSRSDADVLVYMDVDLSTDLAALLPLVAPLLTGHSDLAIGSRLARGATVVRGPKREVISRCYNALLHTVLRTRFSDAQCGFKAIRADRARALLPQVRDESWFFDTELLVLAERAGLRIHEVPVDWIDDPDSRVDVVATALADLRGVARLARAIAGGRLPARGTPSFNGQALRFAGVGAASTIAYLILYVLFRGAVDAQGANALALLATAVANTAANRRLTFAVRGRHGAVRHHVQGLVLFGIALGITAGGLGLLHALDPGPGRVVEVAALVVANLAATLVRFVLMRAWVFRGRSVPSSVTEVGR
jgi:putative flippase GtrA